MAIIGALVLVLCCLGGGVIALSGDDDEPDDPDPAGQPTEVAADQPDGEPTGEPDGADEPEATEPEPAGYGAGTWEVGEEIEPGTYVTGAPDGGVFDSCYWARLSGFSGDFDEIIANGNLDAGARGRVTISDSDAGIEFSGDCQWVEVSEAAPVEVGDEIGAGVWAVGDEIDPGTYVTDAPDGDTFDSCYWARLSGFSGEFDDLITNGNVEAGGRGRVEIAASDAGIEFTGGCVWTRT